MSIVVETEQEAVQEGLDVLTKNLPPSKVARLLSIWRIGRGDYTADRRKLFVARTRPAARPAASRRRPRPA